MPNVFTAKELAERWKCGTDSIYRMVKSGKLRAFKIGSDIRIREDEILKYEEGG
jgi:excisionase family DNA binding protein